MRITAGRPPGPRRLDGCSRVAAWVYGPKVAGSIPAGRAHEGAGKTLKMPGRFLAVKTNLMHRRRVWVVSSSRGSEARVPPVNGRSRSFLSVCNSTIIVTNAAMGASLDCGFPEIATIIVFRARPAAHNKKRPTAATTQT
jgi:hypothetical protein